MKIPYSTLRIDDEIDLRDEVRGKLDEFLDVYSLYLATRFSWIRDEVKLKAFEIHLLDPSFSFSI